MNARSLHVCNATCRELHILHCGRHGRAGCLPCKHDERHGISAARCSCSRSGIMTLQHALHQAQTPNLFRESDTTSRGSSEQPPRSYATTLKSHRQASMISRASRRSRVGCRSWKMSLFQTRVPLWNLRSHMSYDKGAVADASGC
jgi:hypothetical protein